MPFFVFRAPEHGTLLIEADDLDTAMIEVRGKWTAGFFERGFEVIVPHGWTLRRPARGGPEETVRSTVLGH